MLSRDIAARGHYPAIDVLQSISRLASAVNTEELNNAISIVRQILATHQENEDLISIGAYREGSNPLVDTAVALQEPLNLFLRQAVDESSSLDLTRQQLLTIAKHCQAMVGQFAAKGGGTPQGSHAEASNA